MTNIASQISTQLIVLTLTGGGIILPVPYDIPHELIPSKTYTYKSMELKHEWENKLSDSVGYNYQELEIENIEIIKSFSLKLLSQMKDMDEDLVKASNEVFWDSL